MFCFRYKKLLMPYAEGVLDERTSGKVEAHIAHCESCAAELMAVRSISGVLKTVDSPAMEPAGDLWAKVSARIESESPARASRPWLRATQAASACAAAVLFAAVGIGLMHPSLPVPEKPVPTERDQVRIARDMPAPVSPKAPAMESKRRVPVERFRAPKRTRSMAAASSEAPHRGGSPADGTAYDRLALGTPAPAPPASEPGRLGRNSGTAPEWWSSPPVGGDDESDAGVTERAPATSLPLTASQPAAAPAARDADMATEKLGVHLDSVDAAYYAYTPSTPSATTGTAAKPAAAAGVATAAPAPCSLGGLRVADSWEGADKLALSDSRPASRGVKTTEPSESVVDTLNKTEGVRVVALFAYP